MLTIRWADEASTDLVEIIDYIEQRSPFAAESLLIDILKATEGIPSAPYLFRYGREPGTREYVVHPNYIVVYQVGTDTIDVLRILHARQQYP